jgi:benzoylformate decarboxylase
LPNSLRTPYSALDATTMVTEKTAGVPGLDLPGLDVVGTAASYGVDAHEAHTTDEVIKLVESGIADRERPTLINARTTPVDA